MSSLRFGIFVMVILFFSVVTHARELTREQWIDSFTRSFPVVFCGPGQYARECFDVSQDECENTASSAIENCIDKYVDKMPEVFTAKDGQYWGNIIGKCAGEKYALELTDYIIDSEECRSVRKWK